MGEQDEKNHRDEYQVLFEEVPCIITVQDKDFRLVKYNRLFDDMFAPEPGDYCYHAYKNRASKCPVCPVEKTFEDGQAHYSEELGLDKDGRPHVWVVNTAPIKNAQGEIVAAMEMCLDVTLRKNLEERLEESEKKYYAIFNNIPNPVFVVGIGTMEILDCNESVKDVYGFDKEELKGKSLLSLFMHDEQARYSYELRNSTVINQVRHVNKEGRTLFVTIRISLLDLPDKTALLVTTTDITKRLEAEQQVIQAGKMATLGEMATGVAHELNQPLSVLKTASAFLMKKIRKNEPIEKEILNTLAGEIDSHVVRAANIINHLREFGRKSGMKLEMVQVNTVLEKAFEIFGQQLMLRGIEVVRRLEENLPLVMAEPGRLEQVFINLLLNARDAIEDKWKQDGGGKGKKRITLTTKSDPGRITIEVADNGIGVDQAISEKIFEPFFTTKKAGEGTGLGLSISYGLIQDCKGVIFTVPNEDGGATFVIRIPRPKES